MSQYLALVLQIPLVSHRDDGDVLPRLFSCVLGDKEIEKKKLAKDNAEKLYKEALAKEKAQLRLLNKIYQPYVLGPNTAFKINYLDGVFKANSTPENSQKLHDDELHKAHIRGVIESDKLNKNLAINSLASIRESEDFTALVLITNENEIAPLKDFAKPQLSIVENSLDGGGISCPLSFQLMILKLPKNKNVILIFLIIKPIQKLKNFIGQFFLLLQV